MITNPEKKDQPSDIQVLCKTMIETIRAVTSKPNHDIMFARQKVVKDFTLF